MKHILFAATLAIAATSASAQLITETPTTKTYAWPGTAACYDKGVRISPTAFERVEEADAFVVKYLADKRAKDPATPALTAYCQPTRFITNELKPTPVVTPPPPPPPVVVVPVVATTPGIGQIPPSGMRINAGSGIAQIGTTTEVARAGGDGTGAFRTVCIPSHYAFDDPIVFPGQPGRSHLHMFFGNTATNAFSTAASTLAIGDSTCRGGIINRSAYWVPAMIDMTTNLPVNADKIDGYYKIGYLGVKASDIRPLPTGLRILAGDSMNRVASSFRPYSWKCHNNGAVKSATIILDCPVGDQLELEVNFPQCHDGKNLDSPDGKSHMAYATGNGCPASHPVALVEVSFHVLWPLKKAGEAANWRLSSDTYTGPAGLSAHADWVGGWRKDVSDSFSLNCVGKNFDCHSHLTGDGRALY